MSTESGSAWSDARGPEGHAPCDHKGLTRAGGPLPLHISDWSVALRAASAGLHEGSRVPGPDSYPILRLSAPSPS